MLGLGLHYFGNHREYETLTNGHDGTGDGLIVGIVRYVTHERFVDLELIDRQAFEVAQRGIAGAEVVDRDGDAQLLEAIEHAQRPAGLLHDQAFGDLELEVAGVQTGSRQYPPHGGDDVAALALHARQIDRDALELDAVLEPALYLRIGDAQHPFTYRFDQAGFFGKRHEAGRRDDAELRMAPAQSRLGADQPTTMKL